ncbi:GNAT family N-acetyltransferase [Peribacillus kribbensis]|uniref:GNAT family N-acetyltransferase n=1 Tax=Peribacillus kribbensis TaxID=356658 RepID=UPI0006866465|nr:GNAT family N-acetyltransferase [Peribacillus kribbensis]
MTIRRANPMETDYILQISGGLVQESSAGHLENQGQNGYNLFLPMLQNGAYYLIDEDFGKLKGFILLGTHRHQMTGRTIGLLLHVYVFPGFRKSGIGRMLMQSAIHELHARGIDTIQLNVYTGNPAKSLYEKLGFTSVSAVMELKKGIGMNPMPQRISGFNY